MKRALIISGSVLLGLIVIIGIAIAVLLMTPLGMNLLDRFSRPVIADVVEQQLGSEISYAPLAGNLPGELVIRDLELSADGEVWAKADRFVLRWHPLDLLGGEVHIQEIVLADGALYALPPETEDTGTAEEPEEEATTGGASLPDIRIGELVIDDFLVGEAVFGQEQVFTLEGGGTYRGEKVQVHVAARTEEDTDVVNLDAVLDENGIEADLVVLSVENGLVSELISTEGRTELRAE